MMKRLRLVCKGYRYGANHSSDSARSPPDVGRATASVPPVAPRHQGAYPCGSRAIRPRLACGSRAVGARWACGRRVWGVQVTCRRRAIHNADTARPDAGKGDFLKQRYRPVFRLLPLPGFRPASRPTQSIAYQGILVPHGAPPLSAAPLNGSVSQEPRALTHQDYIAHV